MFSKKLKYGLIVVVILVICTIAYNFFENSKRTTLVIQMAERFGQTSYTKTISGRYCWEVLNTRCAVYSHFLTDLDINEIQRIVDIVAPEKTIPSDLSILPLDEIQLRSKIKIESILKPNAKLQVPGVEDLVMREWNFTYDGRKWDVILYRLKDARYDNYINGKKIDKNYMKVMMFYTPFIGNLKI